MIVIGTAGHIDHGKSAIVKRLTGTDPDRLPEEKSRGMTIDLGFAFYQVGDVGAVALVDVPGHERFVKNMIAGAGGIDAVLMVVAADDGWMPQSEEHFQITRLLGVRHGLIVINKTDLAEPDWLELLEQDIRDKVAGSFLQDAPILKVSAETGDGFEALTTQLNRLAQEVAARTDIGKARLAIDRSFIRQGIGGVVTGTLRGGCLQVGQTIGVWPARVTGKVRTLQSNGRDVEQAVPGQRTAVSLTGVDRERLVRGGVISDRTDLEYFHDRPVLALSAEMLPAAPVALSDRRRVLLIVGTTEVEGEVRLFDRKDLKPSETDLLFFRPDDPTYTLIGDHYILRLPTPMVTLGGGRVLDHLPGFPRRKQLPALGYLRDRMTGGLDRLVISEARKRILARKSGLLEDSDHSATEIDATVERLIKEDQLVSGQGYVLDQETIGRVTNEVTEVMEREFEDQPHLKGLPVEKLTRILPYPKETVTELLTFLVGEKQLVARGDLYDLAGRGMSLKGIIKQVHDEILASLTDHKFDPPTLSSLASGGKIHQQAIKYILDAGEGVKCGSDFIFLTEAWAEVVAFVRGQIDQSGKLTVVDLREKFGFTRKFAIPVLEDLDRRGITQREGDVRVKGKKYEG